MTKAKEFEKQVSRIYELLEAGTAEVTWDEKIPDPDNPKQLRQIDITVKKNNHITHVECRSHKNPQGTQWIEELYGRKISLEANSMVAVSDSGFSEGAIKKANKLGIFVRNLSQLTKEEVTHWGSTTTISIYYYVLSNIEVTFVFNKLQSVSAQVAVNDFLKNPLYVDKLFNNLKYYFNNKKNISFPCEFRVDMASHNMRLCNNDVLHASVKGRAKNKVFRSSCSYIYEFQSKDKGGNTPEAKVEISNGLNSEVIKSSNGLSSIYFDLSNSPPPPINSILAGKYEFDAIPVSKDNPPNFLLTGSHEQQFLLTDAKFIMASLI